MSPCWLLPAWVWPHGTGESLEPATPDASAVRLVGRDKELGLLRQRWAQSTEGLARFHSRERHGFDYQGLASSYLPG